LRNESLTLFGDGLQTRSFCYVDDLIQGLLKLFFTENISEPINLGNPEPITMIQLAKEILELTNSNSKIEFLPLPQDDPVQRNPEISKAKLLLNWSPTVNRENGLRRTVDYFADLKVRSHQKLIID
jgi:nucleoside-diphosphate-sugar epimerase